MRIAIGRAFVTMVLGVTLGVAACTSPPTDFATKSHEFEFVGWHESTGRLDPTPYRGVLVYVGPGEIGWKIVPKGYDWDGDEATYTDAIRFLAASDLGLPDDIGRRFRWASVVYVESERAYRVLVGPERGRGEPVSELDLIDWNGRVRTLDLDPGFWRMQFPPKHEPKHRMGK